MICLIKGRQRQHKTTVMTGLAIHFVNNSSWRDRRGWHKYTTADIVSNIYLYQPASENVMANYKDGLTDIIPHGEELKEYHFLRNNSLRQYIHEMIQNEYKGKIVLIDEIDNVFSHRFWQQKEQIETLLGFWQDEKMGNIILSTAHKGLSMDILIRECAQIELLPEYDSFNNMVNIDIINALDGELGSMEMNNIDLIKQCFDTYQPVK